MCLCWVANIFFLPYRTTHPRIYLRKKNLATCKNYYSLVLFPLVVVLMVICGAALPY